MKTSPRLIQTIGVVFLLIILGAGNSVSRAQDSSESASRPDKKIDQTGIKWVMPFSQVLEKAKKENRIIAIKMIAFGTNHTGCW